MLHVLEEWPRFTAWARLDASIQFTQCDYNSIDVAGIAASLLAPLIVSRFPNHSTVFIFFALSSRLLSCSIRYFTWAHRCLTRSYRPCVITVVAIYLPLFGVVAELACKGGLLGIRGLVATLGARRCVSCLGSRSHRFQSVVN